MSMSKFGTRMFVIVGLAAVALWATAVPVQAKHQKGAAEDGAKHGEHVSGALTKNADGTITVDGKTFTVDAKCKFRTADKKTDATLADFKDGDVVHVGYADVDGKLVANSVGLRPAGHHKDK